MHRLLARLQPHQLRVATSHDTIRLRFAVCNRFFIPLEVLYLELIQDWLLYLFYYHHVVYQKCLAASECRIDFAIQHQLKGSDTAGDVLAKHFYLKLRTRFAFFLHRRQHRILFVAVQVVITKPVYVQVKLYQLPLPNEVLPKGGRQHCLQEEFQYPWGHDEKSIQYFESVDKQPRWQPFLNILISFLIEWLKAISMGKLILYLENHLLDEGGKFNDIQDEAALLNYFADYLQQFVDDEQIFDVFLVLVQKIEELSLAHHFLLPVHLDVYLIQYKGDLEEQMLPGFFRKLAGLYEFFLFLQVLKKRDHYFLFEVTHVFGSVNPDDHEDDHILRETADRGVQHGQPGVRLFRVFVVRENDSFDYDFFILSQWLNQAVPIKIDQSWLHKIQIAQAPAGLEGVGQGKSNEGFEYHSRNFGTAVNNLYINPNLIIITSVAINLINAKAQLRIYQSQ